MRQGWNYSTYQYKCFAFPDIDEPETASLPGFPPVEERSRPDGAEEELPDQNRTSGDDGDDEDDEVVSNNIHVVNIRYA